MKLTDSLRDTALGTFRAESSGTFLNQAFQVLIFIYQFVAAAVFVAAIFLGTAWLKLPFMGAFYGQTLVFGSVGPSGDTGAWNLYNQGVRTGDQLVRVDGEAVHSAIDVQNVLNGFFPGETIPVTIRSAGGSEIACGTTAM